MVLLCLLKYRQTNTTTFWFVCEILSNAYGSYGRQPFVWMGVIDLLKEREKEGVVELCGEWAKTAARLTDHGADVLLQEAVMEELE